jgi:hypothetical protein
LTTNRKRPSRLSVTEPDDSVNGKPTAMLGLPVPPVGNESPLTSLPLLRRAKIWTSLPAVAFDWT